MTYNGLNKSFSFDDCIHGFKNYISLFEYINTVIVPVSSWWCYNMETVTALLAFWKAHLHKRPVIHSFNLFFILARTSLWIYSGVAGDFTMMLMPTANSEREREPVSKKET